MVILTLATAISATTTVFSLADAILWHPMPFRDPDRLVRVRVNRPANTERPDLSALSRETPFIVSRAFWYSAPVLVTGTLVP
jgi:hypothetical protein